MDVGASGKMRTASNASKVPVIVTANRVALLLSFAFMIAGSLTGLIHGQEMAHSLPTCDQASGASASISSVGSSAPLTLRPVFQDGRIVAVGHVYARNDSGFPLSQWCARAYFLDYLDRSEKVRLSLNGVQQSIDNVCIPLTVDAGLINEFTLSIEADQHGLPISGLVTLQASGSTERLRSSAVRNHAAVPLRGTGVLGTHQPERCTAISKEIWQSVVLPSTQSASHGGELLLLTGLIGGSFLVGCLGSLETN